MKYAFIALAFAFFALGNSLFGQIDEEYDFQPEKVNGGFRNCKILFFPFLNDTNNFQLETYIEFDSLGNKIYEIKNKDMYNTYILYEYDKKQRLISSKLIGIFHEINNTFADNDEYFYNINGKLSEIHSGIINDTICDVIYFKYDSFDNLIEKTQIIYENDTINQFLYKYSTDNSIKEIEEHNYKIRLKYSNNNQSKEHLIITHKYKYTNGILNKIIDDHDFGQYIESYHFVRDKNKNLLHLTACDKNDNLHRFINYKYDDYNNLIEKISSWHVHQSNFIGFPDFYYKEIYIYSK